MPGSPSGERLVHQAEGGGPGGRRPTGGGLGGIGVRSQALRREEGARGPENPSPALPAPDRRSPVRCSKEVHENPGGSAWDVESLKWAWGQEGKLGEEVVCSELGLSLGGPCWPPAPPSVCCPLTRAAWGLMAQ